MATGTSLPTPTWSFQPCLRLGLLVKFLSQSAQGACFKFKPSEHFSGEEVNDRQGGRLAGHQNEEAGLWVWWVEVTLSQQVQRQKVEARKDMW